MGETYLIAFPDSVDRVLKAVSWVNLELDGLGVPLSCYGLGSFQAKLTFLVLAPVGVLLPTKVISWCRRDRAHERERVRHKDTSHATHKVRVGAIAFRESMYKFSPVALRFIFLAFPAISSLVCTCAQTCCKALPCALFSSVRHASTIPLQAFKAFQCVDLDVNDEKDGPAVMTADLSITCWGDDNVLTPEYRRVLYLAAVAIAIYPVGVPVTCGIMLWKARHAFWSGKHTKLSQSVDFLTDECDAATPPNPS